MWNRSSSSRAASRACTCVSSRSGRRVDRFLIRRLPSADSACCPGWTQPPARQRPRADRVVPHQPLVPHQPVESMSQNIYDRRGGGPEPLQRRRRQHQNTMRLDGKVVVITGGGTGIGAAAARRYAAEGAKVVLIGRRQEPLHAVAAETGGFAVAGERRRADESARRRRRARALRRRADRRRRRQRRRPRARLGSTPTTPPGRSRPTQRHDRVPARPGRAAAPDPVARPDRGRVVARRAVRRSRRRSATRRQARADRADEVARARLRPHGVRVNAVCPGWVQTPMADEQMDDFAALGAGEREEGYRW